MSIGLQEDEARYGDEAIEGLSAVSKGNAVVEEAGRGMEFTAVTAEFEALE